MTLEVVHRHEKLPPESGVEFRSIAPISGAGFWSVCHRPKDMFNVAFSGSSVDSFMYKVSLWFFRYNFSTVGLLLGIKAYRRTRAQMTITSVLTDSSKRRR